MSRYRFVEGDDFTNDMPFGEFVRKKRRLMGLNQTELGEYLGVGQGTISQWELGDTSPSIEEARYIIKRLGGELRIVSLDKRDSENPMRYNPWQE